MIGHLVAIQPWFADQSEKSHLKRLGDLMTFEIDQSAPLLVQHLYPRNSPPQNFPLSTRYAIHEIEAPPLEVHRGCCFDAESSRVLNIRPLK
jgi:hypothetical protein